MFNNDHFLQGHFSFKFLENGEISICEICFSSILKHNILKKKRFYFSPANILGFSFTLQRTNCKPLCIVSQSQNEGLIYHVIYFWFMFLFWTSFWVWGYKQNNLTVYLWLNKWHKDMLGKNSFWRRKIRSIVSNNYQQHLFIRQAFDSVILWKLWVPVLIKGVFFSSWRTLHSC